MPADHSTELAPEDLHTQGECSGFPGPDKTEIYFWSAIYDVVHVRHEKTEKRACYAPFLWGCVQLGNFGAGI